MPDCCTHNLAEIQRLDGELAKARQERDEARDECERLRAGLRKMRATAAGSELNCIVFADEIDALIGKEEPV